MFCGENYILVYEVSDSQNLTRPGRISCRSDRLIKLTSDRPSPSHYQYEKGEKYLFGKKKMAGLPDFGYR